MAEDPHQSERPLGLGGEQGKKEGGTKDSWDPKVNRPKRNNLPNTRGGGLVAWSFWNRRIES